MAVDLNKACKCKLVDSKKQDYGKLYKYIDTDNDSIYIPSWCPLHYWTYKEDPLRLQKLDLLRTYLSKHNYKTKEKYYNNTDTMYLQFKNKHIVGQYYYNKNSITHDYRLLDKISNVITIDNKRIFDKYTTAPVNLPLPCNKKQVDLLHRCIDIWVSSKTGYDTSDRYKYEQYIYNYNQIEKRIRNMCKGKIQ